MKLFLIGGFLGSGKTTAIQQACLLLQKEVRVGVITNDQGVQLVDSAFIQSIQVPTREVVSGCFCCNYKDLDVSIRSLAATEQPEIIFAESVGSCTDLIATVVNPLLRFHPDLEITVSVFADARLLLNRHQQANPLFAEEVQYIYEKQLEEADVLVVSKVDLLTPDHLKELKEYLLKQLPDKKILYQNSLNPASVTTWLHTLKSFRLSGKRKALDLNYATYGAGEAKLAWLDQEVEVVTFNNMALEASRVLIDKMHSKIKAGSHAIGHLKFMIMDKQRKQKISFVSLHQPELEEFEILEANRVFLLINARVQTEPDTLKQILATSILELEQEINCHVVERKMLAFKPGFPKPTHRILS